MLFGAGEFDDVFGDICELPEVKQLMEQLQKELLASHSGRPASTETRDDVAEELAAAETEYCRGLARKLLDRVEGRVQGQVSIM